MRPPREHGKWSHSKIPTCAILYNFTLFIWSLKAIIYFLIFFSFIILSNVILQYTKNTSVQYNVDITNKPQLHI